MEVPPGPPALSRRSLLLAGPLLAACRNPLPPVPPLLSGPVVAPLPTSGRLSAAHRRGMNYAHLHVPALGYGSPRSLAEHAVLADMGIEEVVLTPFAYQPAIDGPELHWGGDRTLSDAAMLAEARALLANGKRVAWKPHLWARAFSAGLFPGDIAMDGPEDWARWFENYTVFAMAQATLAATAGATTFCVGTECTRATLENPGAWGAVARKVRAIFPGALTYAANWYGEIDAFTDWADFDFIGVNAYFPLSERPAPTVEDLVAGWAEPLGRLSTVAGRYGKPVVFTEAGYEARPDGARQPWGGNGGAEDPALQARAYEALLRAAVPQPWFGGVWWWKWFTGGPDNGIDESAFSPREAAREVLRRWG